MKIMKIAALACALITPLTGTPAAAASAYPVKHPKLIANPLYATGALPATTCAEPPVKRNNRKLGKAYINAMIACLETTWEQHLTAVNMPYRKVRVQHLEKFPKKYCGYTFRLEDDSQSDYCGKTSTLTFQLGKDWLDDPTDLWMLYQAGDTYGMHVQQLAGIADVYETVYYRNKSEDMEQRRRYNLQRKCLTGAFVKSIWPMEGRTEKDWIYLLSLIRGDSAKEKDRDMGKTSSIRYWLRQGFATGDPASCNTWTASSAKVA